MNIYKTINTEYLRASKTLETVLVSKENDDLYMKLNLQIRFIK